MVASSPVYAVKEDVAGSGEVRRRCVCFEGITVGGRLFDLPR